MNLNNLSIGKLLAMNFSLIIGFILVVVIAVFISNRRVRLESSKQVMLNNLLASNAALNSYLVDFIQSGNDVELDSAKVYFFKFKNQLEILKPVVTKKNYGVITSIEGNIKVVEDQFETLENSNQLIAQTSQVLENSSSTALSIAARVMGGEVSQGVQQFLNIRIMEKNYLISIDEELFREWLSEIDDNIRLASKLGLNEIVKALEQYKESFIKHAEAKKSILDAKNKSIAAGTRTQSLLQKGVLLSAGLLNDSAKRGLTVIIPLVLSIVLLSSLIAFRVTRSITKPLSSGVELAHNLSMGNLVIRASESAKRSDEFGKLSRALNDMSEKLKEVISIIYISSNHIAAASEQLSTTSQQVSQGASEQASSSEEISA
ncbi:MAG TPA: methyl-accepting chemotaxis protein, partial [Bacteroidales bacterium]|nr:methyl-accepting chemotaxis protein [Bacteroidales bacterium]